MIRSPSLKRLILFDVSPYAPVCILKLQTEAGVSFFFTVLSGPPQQP